ncbi:MAG TPA: M20/M25/M40 family metallo-hydrolase, partial [Vicinamibacterales bacterium]
NVHIERFLFGQGWSIDRFSIHLLTPSPAALIGQPRWYSPSTNGTVTSDVIHVKASNEAELAKYKGQLSGKIVILQPVRTVRMLQDRVVLQMNDADWAEAMKLPDPRPTATPAPTPTGPTPQQFAQIVQRFLVDEGAAVVLDRGGDGDLSAGGSDLSWQTQRVDGGTIFPGNGGSRDPKAPQQVPSATLAVEHYNRLVRMIEHGQPVRMEVNIKTQFHPETNPEGNAFNIIAEIPGTDLANEVVIMGAHFDTYPYATGATDNTTGSSAMIEAVRVIQKLGLKPRRTIRLALWAAEEQGLLGSRDYVARHFFDTKSKTPKPGQENVQAYFNLDNGTGRIVGIWGQGNTGAMKNFEQWGAALKDLGWKNVSPRSVTQTDHGSFEEAGIPGFQFIQERLEYNSRTHHSNMDTFDHVQKDDVIQQGAVAAVFAWYAANTPEKLPRKAAK